MDSHDLAPLIKLVVERAQAKAQTAELSLRLKMPAGLPPVRCDEDKIAWVISQLLDNALKFTPKGGRVVVQAKAENGMVNISVSDTGIGIPHNRIQEIFEPFHQLDGSTTRRYPGTGLGLALVRRIVEAHGAQINVHSVAGRGSMFEFSLPVSVKSQWTEDKKQVTHE
jgi:signal transduction histidine kinase